MDSIQAPVALFAYARVDHLRQTVTSLLANAGCRETRLYVFCDGPRRPEDKVQTDAVRAYVEQIEGFASVTRIYRDRNIGLAGSIIAGVSQVLAQHGTIIVMEDDLVVSPHFLAYMNDSLRLYRDEARVASIHGYVFPVGKEMPETFFLRGADCWGWATWDRAWAHFQPDGEKLLQELTRKRLTRSFDLDASYPYTKMLRNQIAGKNNSWAIRWRASCYLRDMLTLYPGRSLVNNIGMDNSGEHCSTTDAFLQATATHPVVITRQPLEEDADARRAFAEFLKKQSSLLARGKRFLDRQIARLT